MTVKDFVRSLILPLDLIDKYCPKTGTIYELGCGEGIISKYLAKEKKRKITAIDSDPKRLPKEKKTNLEFSLHDITKYDLKKTDCVVVSDVLHHINKTEQRKLLQKIFKNLNKKGKLLIKEIDTSEYLRSTLSRLWDYLLYPQDQIDYWNSNDLIKFLISIGFKVNMLRTNRLFPGSTTLFVCKK